MPGVRFASLFRAALWFALAGLWGCAGERPPAPSPKQPLAAEDAAIKFVGDESFVQSRFTRSVRYRDYEALTFAGGFMSYGKAHPGYGLTSSLQQHIEIIDEFRNFKPARQLRLTISEDDVRAGRNRYGAYAVASNENAQGACIRVLQLFGPARKPSSPGNQRVRLGACWAAGDGVKQRLEAFAHDLMARVHFGDGTTGRAGASAGR